MSHIASLALALSVIGPAIANDFVGKDCVVDEVVEAAVDHIMISEEDPATLKVSLLQHAHTHSSVGRRNTSADSPSAEKYNSGSVASVLQPGQASTALLGDTLEAARSCYDRHPVDTANMGMLQQTLWDAAHCVESDLEAVGHMVDIDSTGSHACGRCDGYGDDATVIKVTTDSGDWMFVMRSASSASAGSSRQQQEVAHLDSTNETGVGKPREPALVFDGNNTDAFETLSGKVALLSAGTVAATVWEHFDFLGRSLHLDVSTEYLPGQWNDQISSFIVNPGYCVTFFEDFNYNGLWWRLCAGSIPYQFRNMQHGMNDRVSSLMLSRKHDDGLAATVFEHTGFSGFKWELRQSTQHAGFLNDHISSFEVRPFYCATLYTDVNYGGAWRQYCAGISPYRVSNLVDSGWNDRVSSIWLSRRF